MTIFRKTGGSGVVLDVTDDESVGALFEQLKTAIAFTRDRRQ